MTSAEKVAELRQAVTVAVAGLDRDSELGEQLLGLLGTWQLVPGFVRRKLVGFVREQVPLELLADAAALDDLLGLLAGLALELRTDDGFDWADPYEPGVREIKEMRKRAGELLEQVRALAA